MDIPAIVLGGGGHAKVLIDILKLKSVPVIGITVPQEQTGIIGVPVIGDDDEVFRFSPDSVRLVNGIGSAGNPERRIRLFETFKKAGYRFMTVIHPFSYVSQDAVIGEGTQVMAGAVIQPGTNIGCNCIVNTKASVDHDCRIGDHVHVAPGATICGGVTIGTGTHIGAGATVIQSKRLGERCMVGAGALVNRDVRDTATVIGIPAKEVSR
jgi:sugar O-acyltransferase (sialic acid O-acetyltransferase NeuD family)